METEDCIVQARITHEYYYILDKDGNIDSKLGEYEVNDCIPPEYVVRERTGENCYADLADYDNYEDALKHLKELKGEQKINTN